jgi:hypothetical protein
VDRHFCVVDVPERARARVRELARPNCRSALPPEVQNAPTERAPYRLIAERRTAHTRSWRSTHGTPGSGAIRRVLGSVLMRVT